MTSRIAVAKRASYLSIWTILLAGSAVAAPKKQQLAQTDAAPQINYYNAPGPSERLAAGAAVSSQNSNGQSHQQIAHQSTYQGHNTHSAAQYDYYAPAATAQPQPSSRKTLKSLFKNASAANHYSQPATTVQNASYSSGLPETVGKASWYGSDFHGGKTANGERYNMESLTAAHRTLPFGSQVKVTCLDSGRECVVRINNRGPYIKGRILDLSKAAARQIGLMGKGVGRVKMQVLSYGG